MAHIVVAEDDTKQAEIIRRYLVAEGHDVRLAADGRTALDSIRGRLPDLVVLDVMMPRLDGFDVCRALRAEPATEILPILMLTARAEENDLLDGLDLGADDYLTKPFSPRELLARIRALLRRGRREPREAGGRLIVAGPLVIDPATHTVTFRDELVACTRGEFSLLEAFAAQPRRVFRRTQLLGRLHEQPGSERWVTPRTVDMHVANLRRKTDPRLLRTVYGVGYTLDLLT